MLFLMMTRTRAIVLRICTELLLLLTEVWHLDVRKAIRVEQSVNETSEQPGIQPETEPEKVKSFQFCFPNSIPLALRRGSRAQNNILNVWDWDSLSLADI